MKMLQKSVLILMLFFIVLVVIVRAQDTTSKATPIVASKTEVLSDTDFAALQAKLHTITTEQTPATAMAILRKQSATDAAVARSCHGLAHTIGNDAYNKYQDFGQAMKYQDDICNSGYIHGVIESHFTKSNDIFTTMKTVCKDYDPKTFAGWECYHGVGHGLMFFTENELPRSIKLCESYTNTDAQAACVNGVFMENFTTDQKLHPSRYLKAQNPLYPCADQKETHKADCYLYTPTFYLSLHHNDYTSALKWCKTAESDYQLACIQGVGMQAMKDTITNPQFVESLCMQEKNESKQACMVGMLTLYMNHFGGLKQTRTLCPKLEKEHIELCNALIADQEIFFENN